MLSSTFVLVTAAHNEARYIGTTIASVVAQSVQPIRWVIVSDASSDGTDDIVASYAREYPFIQLLRLDGAHPRSFGAQVNAISAGVKALGARSYDFIGNLDADVSFGNDYFARLLAEFEANPALGLAGGAIREVEGRTLRPAPGEDARSIPHAVQFFRRECYEAVGGYPALPYGGPDTYAEVAARMRGWQVRLIRDLPVDHHRMMASAGGVVRGRFRQGMMDFTLGYLPLLELVKCARRLGESPILLGAGVRIAGFLWAALVVQQRPVPSDFVRFLRAEQWGRLRCELSLFRWVVGHH